jgi:hypothetical protein
MTAMVKKLKQLREKGLSLGETLEKIIPCLDREFNNIAWNSLNVNYHPPLVERLWAQFDTMRLMIHRIHPTTISIDQFLEGVQPNSEALFHPHPWPSAVFIVSGEYEMGVGYGSTSEVPPLAAKVLLRAGSAYEMTDKDGWHYVAPRKKPSISVMLIDSPWETPHPFYTEGDKVRLNPLTEKARSAVITEFREGLARLKSQGL